MISFDYIIVGAGSSGCVLADRLSADGKSQVLLLEAGPADTNRMISIPKGFGMLLAAGVKETWAIPAESQTGVPAELWWRGRTLGGSSAINGSVYLRGHPDDFNGWERNGATGWGWTNIARAFRAIEDHPLGAGEARGSGGPLKLSLTTPSELCDRVIAAAAQMGLPTLADTGAHDLGGVGYLANAIYRGRRQSAATAFLKPAMQRANLTALTNVLIDRVVFENGRAVGVVSADREEFRIGKRGEVILCAGALLSPLILQRSGVGPTSLLSKFGIPVIADSPAVGQNLHEHRLLTMHYRLKKPLGVNRELRGFGLLKSVLRYLVRGSGALAAGACDVTAFIRTDPTLTRPDAQILVAPFGYSIDKNGQPAIANEDTFHLFGHALGCGSEGSVNIASTDPLANGVVTANYFTDEHYRKITVDMFRFIRRWVRQAPLGDIVGEEISPGPAVESDAEILDAFRTKGHCGLHACGTVRMGSDADDPLDPQLCVRGVSGLRVVDASIMPTPISSNPNGPIMAIAWRAAEIILQARKC